MVIGFDIDGTITKFPRLKARFWWYEKLPWCFYLGLFLVPPEKKIVEFIKEKKSKGDTIIFISARPEKLRKTTELYFQKYRIPYDKIFLVGLEKGVEKRKKEIIQKEKVEIYIDHDN